MEKYIIEQANEEHLNQILEVFERVNTQAHSFLGAESIQLSKELIRDEYFFQSTTLMIRSHNHVIGFLSFIDNEVSDLYVETEYQSKGYGRSLLFYAINNYGCDSVQVFKANEQAFNFYLKCGFEKISSSWDDEFGVESYLMKYKQSN